MATRRQPMHLYSWAVTPDINMGTESSLTHARPLKHVGPILCILVFHPGLFMKPLSISGNYFWEHVSGVILNKC